MLSGYGRHELTMREYEGILLAQEMYARGAEFVEEQFLQVFQRDRICQ